MESALSPCDTVTKFFLIAKQRCQCPKQPIAGPKTHGWSLSLAGLGEEEYHKEEKESAGEAAIG